MKLIQRVSVCVLVCGINISAVAAPSLLYGATLTARPIMLGVRLAAQLSQNRKVATGLAIAHDLVQLGSFVDGMQEHEYNHIFLPLWAGVDLLDLLYHIKCWGKASSVHPEQSIVAEDQEGEDAARRAWYLRVSLGVLASSLYAYCMHARAGAQGDVALRLKLEAAASLCRAVEWSCTHEGAIAQLSAGAAALATVAAAAAVAYKGDSCGQ